MAFFCNDHHHCEEVAMLEAGFYPACEQTASFHEDIYRYTMEGAGRRRNVRLPHGAEGSWKEGWSWPVGSDLQTEMPCTKQPW